MVWRAVVVGASLLLWAIPGVAQGNPDPWAPGAQNPPPPSVQPPEAGGLAAPGAGQPDDETGRRLEAAERGDSGRGLDFFWIEPLVGFRGVHVLDASVFDGAVIPSESYGLALGAGAGVRLLYFTAGVQFRYGVLSAWDLWTLGLDVGLRVPLGDFEPYFGLGGGFAAVEGATNDAATISPTALGGDVRVFGGLDYFVTPVFSVGARLGLEMIVLGRDAVSTGGGGTPYASSGSGVALSYEPAVVLGIHL